MQNPYQPPGVAVSDTDAAAQSRRQTGFFVMGVLCALIGALVPTILVPGFKELFASFGSELPLATSVLLRFYPALWIFPALLLAARAIWPKTAQRSGTVAVAGLLFLVIVAPLTLYLLYLPAFQMSEAF